MAMQSSDRAGYDVLRDHFAEFCFSGIDPVCIANNLFQSQLINSAVKDESTVQGCRRDLQLKTIIDAVMRQGKPGAFQEFTEIIAADCSNSWLADKLKRAYFHRGGKWTSRIPPDSLGNRTISLPQPDPPLEECHRRRTPTYPLIVSNHHRGSAPCKPLNPLERAHQPPIVSRTTPTETKLQLKDVFEPIKTLAAEEWRDIGEALHIEGVESIPSTPGITRTDDAYLREVLRRWLNTIDPSIQDLITALRKCYREEAAKVLESLFAIGGNAGVDDSLHNNVPRLSQEVSSHGPSEIAVCTLVAKDVAGADHCLVSSDGGSTKLKAYKMMTSPHGIALVISNIKFDTRSGLLYRAGADVDENKLQELFGSKYLNYKVVLLKNLTGKQIDLAFRLVSGHEGSTYAKLPENDREALKALNDGTALISHNHDSFVCCLLSHGKKGIVYGSDGKNFDLNSIYNYLGPCKHLAGKPKMAFIQACQGTSIATVPSPCVEDDGDDLHTTETCDFILSYAAFHGQKSFRWTEGEGTWYISALCKIFKENHKKMDVVSMITDVHKEVTNTRSDDLRQCPRLEHSLRHNMHFAVKGGWGGWSPFGGAE